MIFKQGILKEEKIKFGIITCSITVIYIIIIILSLINKTELKLLTTYLIIFAIPVYLLLILIEMKNMEWYYIYKDRIEARNIFGVKNIVYYNNISFVEEWVINLTTRGMGKTFYIFNDGRKNNNNIFDINSCYNNKKFNLKIYKTDKLEEYIKSILEISILTK